ncbi:2Fe-2S iron-sulfur cluster-binding protein [Variovorax sp. WS11]|uniref:2Fe-2S iron-sulfur cluster-binding protein n=1 Tax=Variovorax sp. WS11 TaxID=1105204 RepID=UPI0013DBB4B7|nr:2Fe-2S iron-sulfur cluster-binding protein [Variovorax sp. WS11]NDZ17734.1 2Fe-2S iron-sulfur cluster binding domain-containing protein [Variovorax sp. WS11]
MVAITLISRNGASQQVHGDEGDTVMHVIRSAVDEVEALCGGCCSCATCHVYVHPGFEEQLSPVSAGENELLDSSDHRRLNSRLSCQLVLRENLDGLTVSVAPAD